MNEKITSDKYKAIAVIQSCKTFEQTWAAQKFCSLYLHKYNNDIGVKHYEDLLNLVVKRRNEIKVASN